MLFCFFFVCLFSFFLLLIPQPIVITANTTRVCVYIDFVKKNVRVTCVAFNCKLNQDTNVRLVGSCWRIFSRKCVVTKKVKGKIVPNERLEVFWSLRCWTIERITESVCQKADKNLFSIINFNINEWIFNAIDFVSGDKKIGFSWEKSLLFFLVLMYFTESFHILSVVKIQSDNQLKNIESLTYKLTHTHTLQR